MVLRKVDVLNFTTIKRFDVVYGNFSERGTEGDVSLFFLGADLEWGFD